MNLLMIALLLAAAPDGADWPNKKDVIYVSATLSSASGVSSFLFGGPPPTHEVPPCVPLKVTRSKPKKERWDVQDPAYGGEALMGPWLGRMHRTEAACQETLKALGEPRLVHNGVINRIMPAGSP